MGCTEHLEVEPTLNKMTISQPQRLAALQVGLQFTDLHGNMKHLTVQPDHDSKSHR